MSERQEMRERMISPEERIVRPIVVVDVTLGKELHAGHMLLLTVAELARSGVNSPDPLILVNNNTGPRAAGTLVRLFQQMGTEIEETAQRASQGSVSPDQLVAAYRGRVETGKTFEQAFDLLEGGKYDIFSPIAVRMEEKLRDAGFAVKILPESELLGVNQQVIERVNPLWAGTGFMFFPTKGVGVFQKGGRLTASGKTLTSLVGVARTFVGPNLTPLMVFVDAEVDALDVTHAFSSASESGKAMLLPGAGISLGGKIASGTGGEAFTLDEVVHEFPKRCPNGSLPEALRYMMLTRPAVRVHGDVLALYDFRDNESFVGALAECYQESGRFREGVVRLIETLRGKIGNVSRATDKKTSDFLRFLPHRTKALFAVRTEDVLERMNKFSAVSTSDSGRIFSLVREQGYQGEEANARVRGYMRGRQKFVVRDNYYRLVLNAIIRQQEQILSLAEEDFVYLEETIKFCMRRLGYEDEL